jgi:hypothetical protein
MPYIIKRDDGMYVASSGSKNSYTRDLSKARAYTSLAAAQADKCDNETVLSLLQALGN